MENLSLITKYYGEFTENLSASWYIESETQLPICLCERFENFKEDICKFENENNDIKFNNYKGFLLKKGLNVDLLGIENIIILSLDEYSLISLLYYVIERENREEGYFMRIVRKGIIEEIVSTLFFLNLKYEM